MKTTIPILDIFFKGNRDIRVGNSCLEIKNADKQYYSIIGSYDTYINDYTSIKYMREGIIRANNFPFAPAKSKKGVIFSCKVPFKTSYKSNSIGYCRITYDISSKKWKISLSGTSKLLCAVDKLKKFGNSDYPVIKIDDSTKEYTLIEGTFNTIKQFVVDYTNNKYNCVCTTTSTDKQPIISLCKDILTQFNAFVKRSIVTIDRFNSRGFYLDIEFKNADRSDDIRLYGLDSIVGWLKTQNLPKEYVIGDVLLTLPFSYCVKEDEFLTPTEVVKNGIIVKSEIKMRYVNLDKGGRFSVYSSDSTLEQLNIKLDKFKKGCMVDKSLTSTVEVLSVITKLLELYSEVLLKRGNKK